MTLSQFHKVASIGHVSAFAVLFLGLASAARAAETYIQTEVDSNGQLHILTKRHREIVLTKGPEQVGFEDVRISPDGRAVGWLALYPDCCTSDLIPLKLAIYVSGRLSTFTGSGLPIWRWCFQAEGEQVAFEQETVHGGTGIHYELRDIATGKLVAKYDPDSDSEMTPKPPRWVAEVGSKP
ncbi:MAG TPA: hypothetical protein VG206_04685 [Terriglobia bacterium]|nr:hypothetical protein [Terriglobia bacterium]